jgi:hypothetical protein
LKVVLDLDERTYSIIEEEAKRRGLDRAEQLLLIWIIEKAMTEIKVSQSKSLKT